MMCAGHMEHAHWFATCAAAQLHCEQPGQWAVSLIWYHHDSDVPDGIRYSKQSRVERTIDSCLFVPELKWDMQKPMGFVLSNDHVEKLQAEWLSVRPRD